MPVSNINIFNKMLEQSSLLRNTFTTARVREDIDKMLNEMSEIQLYQEEFLGVFINKIAKTIVYSQVWDNPLGVFDKGEMSTGFSLESAWVMPLEVVDWDYHDPANENPFEKFPNDVKVEYLHVNKANQIRMTTAFDELRTAFRSEGAVQDLLGKLVGQMSDAKAKCQYTYTKQLFAGLYNDVRIDMPLQNTQRINIGTIDYSDQKSIQNFAVIIKDVVSSMKYPTTLYNAQKVPNFATASKLEFFALDNIVNRIGVSLVNMYNPDKLAMPSMKGIDNFGTTASGAGTEKVLACLIDRNAIQIYSQFDKTGGIYNPRGMYENRFNNFKGLYGCSYFHNVVFFEGEIVDPS